MPKQSVKLIFILISAIIMLGLFKTLFGQQDDSQLAAAINDGAFLVDVRTPAEFSGGSVRDAVNIPLDKIPAQLEKFKNKKGVVVFCRSGNRSSQAKRILEQNGIPHVVNGGTWQNVNKAVNK